MGRNFDRVSWLALIAALGAALALGGCGRKSGLDPPPAALAPAAPGPGTAEAPPPGGAPSVFGSLFGPPASPPAAAPATPPPAAPQPPKTFFLDFLIGK